LLIREGETERSEEGVSYVTIMHGCNNFCSYCVVPYVRGREISRPMDEVLAEIKQKIEQGAKTIILLGQNVNSYQYGLANLLRAIEKLSPLFLREGRLTAADKSELTRGEFVSFMTSHPRDISDDIIQAVYDLPYVIKDFHLPLQSGDNTILKAMNRGYTVEFFRDRVKAIRKLLPKARISTDILVGFPGETEEQFQNTLNFVKEIGFTSVNMFAYSPRPQTAASQMPGQLAEEVKQARLQRLITLVRAMLD
ncbi:MAG: MiaB/RimO family radical SAM methylthiotransferase, partial [Candidatus Saganbacteria bacterium]|nr:MiaB/RimO family radical SAM methylthiotransferase [Candidatus Saganbacteria bacterium]